MVDRRCTPKSLLSLDGCRIVQEAGALKPTENQATSDECRRARISQFSEVTPSSSPVLSRNAFPQEAGQLDIQVAPAVGNEVDHPGYEDPHGDMPVDDEDMPPPQRQHPEPDLDDDPIELDTGGDPPSQPP
eukprot:s3770_g3.t1